MQDNATGNIYILAEARVDFLYKKADEYTVLETFKGETLKDKTYKPLFDYFAERKASGAFRVLCDSYVTEDSGCGVVHQVSKSRTSAFQTAKALK